MPVSSDLQFPKTEELFEEMCFHLYSQAWNDPFLNRLGGPGQGQFGLDLIGTVNGKDVGIQCKHYVNTPFTFGTVTGDLDKLDRSDVVVDRVIFTTTAASKTTLVTKIRELSNLRRTQGKCGVSVHFWNELSALLRKHPEVARTYIPGFPGGMLMQVRDRVEATHAVVQGVSDTVLAVLDDMAAAKQAAQAQPVVTRQLELAKEKLLLGRPLDVLELLESLGDPALLSDAPSRSRWHATKASALLMSNHSEEAAREFLIAASILPELEKAYRNKAYAQLLQRNAPQALVTLDEGLGKYPESSLLWALRAAAEHAMEEVDPGKDIPPHLRGTTDVLFTMSGVRHQQGRAEEAFELIRRCVENEKPSFELNRLLLATALGWALSDPVASQLGQLEPGKRQALREGLQAHEPLEVTIPAIQHEAASFEVFSNAVVCLLLLGEVARARKIANMALTRHPFASNLLRVRIEEIEEAKDLGGLRQLAEGPLAQVSNVTLVAIAEAASNLNVPDVFERAASELDARPLSGRERQDFAVLSFHAQWTSGAKEQAIAQAKVHVRTYPRHMLGQVELARMLSRSGEDLAAALHAHAVEELAAAQNASTLEISLAADLLRELRDYAKAAALYARLVHTPDADALTYKYVYCLIESDQRMKAQQLLDQLPIEAREIANIRRLEAELARRKGDWVRTADLLRTELAQYPQNATIALNYVAALHRMKPVPGELTDYLSSNPTFDGKQIAAEVEFAKYEVQHGFQMQALQRFYRLLRDNPSDTMVAGSYLAQIFIGNFPAEISAEQRAGPGTSVLLKAPGEMFEVAIDTEGSTRASWPELVGADSSIAKALVGKATGDIAVLDRNLGPVECEIRGVDSILRFAAQRAQVLLHTAASNEGPAWSVNLAGPDGQIDVDKLLAPAQARKQREGVLLEGYRNSKFPLSTLAKALGKHAVELALGWPQDKAPMFVSHGFAEERDAQLITLRSRERRYVIDLLTLGELVALGLFRHVVPLLDNPLVPTSVRDELVGLLDAERRLPIHEDFADDGAVTVRRARPSRIPVRRLEVLQEMVSCIDELCEVTPVLGPPVLTDEHRTLGLLLDDATLDCVYLCLERDAVLLTDDAGLHRSVFAVNITNAVNVQTVLMVAHDEELISPAQYVEAISSKIARNQEFINLRSEDLLYMVKRNPRKVDPDFTAALNTVRGSQLDLQSAVNVIAETLLGMIELVPPRIFRQYFSASLDALSSGRQQQAAQVQNVLAYVVHSRLPLLPEPLRLKLIHTMGALLHVQPVEHPQMLLRSPVSLAVLELVRRVAEG